jgi:hypothetical protein
MATSLATIASFPTGVSSILRAEISDMGKN